PFPRAFTLFHGEEFKIIGAKIVTEKSISNSQPGEIITVEKDRFFVATGNGVVAITEVQPENKRRMTTSEYLRGHPVVVGEMLN
ncbi:methionyl-tRNA formyltransferase, partial [candidate division KSB1 bacterium]|nr:methionyl-tRNA formyltransferase [candidate division KSB1 bacterium]